MMLTIQTTDLPLTRFPDYVDLFKSSEETMGGSPMAGPTPAAQRLVPNLMDDGSRHPSPQPTQLSRSNGNGHRILRSATVGYVAPEFKGKPEQMKQGGNSAL